MLNFLFNPNGRVSCGGIWLGLVLPQLGLAFAAGLIDGVTMGAALSKGQAAGGLATALVSLFFLWPNIAVPVKRFHDRGMSGWWVLWFALIVVAGVAFALMGGMAAASTGKVGAGALIGIVIAVGAGLAQFVILYLLPGQAGGNQYGPDPRSGSGARADAASTSDWADRLGDPARLSAAAAVGGGKSAKRGMAPAEPHAPRTVNWPNGAGARSSFGRRGA